MLALQSLQPLASSALSDIGLSRSGLSLKDTAQADPNAMTPSFGQTLQAALGQVSDLQQKAGEQTRAFAAGQTSDIHSVMIASEQASVALQLTAQVRNKIVDAYQEVMRMSM